MSKEAPRAAVGTGFLEGAWRNDVAVFRGVPYAAPPVAELRFAPAAPPAAWTSVRPAIADGPVAPQPPSRLAAATGDFTRPQDEDCLTLTIWTPAPDNKARPVLVWLHGGAYMSGAGSLDRNDGGRLAREGDIVVIGVNYRLGAAGYLYRPGISVGNLGPNDQEAALEWIGGHIGAFGGDPANVTVMGQSAGGGSIVFLLTQPTARRLFRRVILQSSSLNAPIAAIEATARADKLLAHLDIDPNRPDAAELARAAPTARLLEAQIKMVRGLASHDSLALPFGPVAPEAMSARDYLDLVAEGAKDKEVLIGWTRHEMHAFMAADPVLASLDEPELAQRSRAITGDPHAIDAYRDRLDGGSPMDVLAAFITDLRFALPAQELARQIARRGGKVWAFRFDWSPLGSKFKACHCIPVPFVFGVLAETGDAQMLAGGDPEEMEALSRTVRQSTIAFVRKGDPGVAGMPAWPNYREEQPTILRFDTEIAPL